MTTRESQDFSLNDLIYRKIKKQLEEQFQGKYAIIAEGKILGIEDSLDNAWALASPYENAIVARITKKTLRAKILGSSLRIAASPT